MYAVAEVQCDICLRKHVSLQDIGELEVIPHMGVECPYCHNMSCYEIEAEDEGDNDQGTV